MINIQKKKPQEDKNLYSQRYIEMRFLSVTALLKAICLLELARGLLPSCLRPSSRPQCLHRHGAAGHPTRLHGLEEGRGLWQQHNNLRHSGVSSRDACGTPPVRVSSVLHISLYPFMCSSTYVPSVFPALLELRRECIRL